MPSKQDTAIKALETSIAVLRARRAKLEEVIADKKFRRKNVDAERAEKATLNRKLGNLRDRLVELQAANQMVSAPTTAEVNEVKRLIRAINDLALADAMRAQGIKFLQGAVTQAMELSGKVKKT
jgi:predicted  nucleic acid-binding Zn-ribbon protein